MATTPSHGIQSGLLAYYALRFSGMALQTYAPALRLQFRRTRKALAVSFVALAMVFGMLPDLFGMYGHAEKALRLKEQGDADWLSARDWSPEGYYRRAHSGDLYERFNVVPFYALHIWVDGFFHKPHDGWREHAYILEILIDLCLVALIVFEWRVRRRRF